MSRAPLPWMTTRTTATALLLVAVTALSALADAAPSTSKRAPFSSWAGKRSSGLTLNSNEFSGSGEDVDALVKELQELYLAQQQREEEAEEAAAAQAEEDMVKRAPFSSWAGKDSSLLDIRYTGTL